MPDHDALLTRVTLLERLRETEDNEAWSEFAEIYTPLLYNYCSKRELRHSDICDIVQEVMRSVSLAMKDFQYEPKKGKFRSWLFTAVRNAITRHYRKNSKVPLTASNTAMLHLIEETPAREEVDRWEADYQQQLVTWAMEKVRPEFSDRIWQAFEETAVHGLSISDVSEKMEMSKNAVMIARHRVTKRLKEKTESIDSDRWEVEQSYLSQNS